MSNGVSVTGIFQAIGAVGTFLVGLGALWASRQFYKWTRRQREAKPELIEAKLSVEKGKEYGAAEVMLFNPGDLPVRLFAVVAAYGKEVAYEGMLWLAQFAAEGEALLPRQVAKYEFKIRIRVPAYEYYFDPYRSPRDVWRVQVDFASGSGTEVVEYSNKTHVGRVTEDHGVRREVFVYTRLPKVMKRVASALLMDPLTRWYVFKVRRREARRSQASR